MLRTIGCDIARSGADQNVAALRADWRMAELVYWSGVDLMETTGRIVQLINQHHPDYVVVDVIGIGAGVFDRLREMEYPVIAFNAAARTDRLDSSGELGFVNCR
ncbi:MAG: hypothetical protein JXA57_17870, partial [Armatimonadetes bacterium]|nr:hypothetical protein [Armatimonadota bacterium]